MELAYLSKAKGIGGAIKQQPEDFVVEEITKGGEVLEVDRLASGEGTGEFARFVLQKRNWDTLAALRAIADALHASARRFGYAGTKDRVAVSTQLCSAWRIEPAQLLALHMKDIKINGAWRSGKKVALGDLLGNRFTITVRGVAKGAGRQIERTWKELNGVVPNYFGEQRFGMRGITALVGKRIVEGDLRGAVMAYLCEERDDNEAALEARRQLSAKSDFAKALSYFPAHLRYERTLLAHLAAHPSDFAGALRRLPRGLSLMFVHAYQARLFNEVLSKRVKEGRVDAEAGDLLCAKNSYGFPDVESATAVAKKSKRTDAMIAKHEAFLCGRIIGYESKDLSDAEKEALNAEWITPAHFRIRPLPELSSKGTVRPLFVPLKDFSYEAGEDALFRFSLPAGAYATVALREFMKK